MLKEAIIKFIKDQTIWLSSHIYFGEVGHLILDGNCIYIVGITIDTPHFRKAAECNYTLDISDPEFFNQLRNILIKHNYVN